ncbi:MAG: hypothetical protein EZS28_037713, partial [Streblomastix strix]
MKTKNVVYQHWILYHRKASKYSIAEHLLEQLTFQIKAGILNLRISKGYEYLFMVSIIVDQNSSAILSAYCW